MSVSFQRTGGAKTGQRHGEQATVSLQDIQLSQTVWSFVDLNLIIDRSNLSKVIIYLMRAVSDNDFIEVTLNNSTIGTLDTEAGFNVTALDCYINGTDRLDETFLHIRGSVAAFSNCVFHRNIVSNNSSGLIHTELFLTLL